MLRNLDEKLLHLGTRPVVYLVAFSFAVHVAYLCQLAATPFFRVPELDSLYDDLAARAIALGHTGHDVFFRAPFYLYFLAGVYRLFGHSYWAARLVQAAIGSASVALAYVLGSRLFRPSVGFFAAAAMAIYGPLVFNDGELHTPVLEVFLDLAFLNLLLGPVPSCGIVEIVHLPIPRRLLDNLKQRDDLPTRWTKWLFDKGTLQIVRIAAAGLVFGLSAITRPTILLTLPLAAWWVWMDRPRRPRPVVAFTAEGPSKTGDGRNRLRSVQQLWRRALVPLIFVSAALAFPAIVTARNWYVSGDPVFIASQGGINLFLGNRPGADGFTPSTPTRYRFDTEYEDSVALYGQNAAEEALGRPLTASETQQYWVDRSVAWWRTNPIDAVRLTFKKMVLVWTQNEIRNNTGYAFARREIAPFLRLCVVGFWIAGPLGLLGMFLGWRSDANVRRLSAFALLYATSFVPFFIADRYRLPIVPILLILGGYAAARVIDMVDQRRWRPVAMAAAALVPAALLVEVNWYRTETPSTWALDYWSCGNRYVKLGDYDRAVGQYRMALRLDPSNGEIWNGLGEALYDSGHPIDAARCFRRSALSPGGDVSRAVYNEALCDEQAGDLSTADKLLSYVVRIDPTYNRARVELTDIERQSARSLPGRAAHPGDAVTRD